MNKLIVSIINSYDNVQFHGLLGGIAWLRKIVIINGESIGRGDHGLGKNLMGAFLKKLWASETKPEAMIFYNSGVKLLAEGSYVLDAMDALANLGVDLIACGTCLAFFDLEHKLRVGRISNMEEIVSILMGAETVITV